jgi:hypothetical protein
MEQPVENKVIDVILLTLNTRDPKYDQVTIKCKLRKDGSMRPLGSSPYLPDNRDFNNGMLHQFHSCKGFFRMMTTPEMLTRDKEIFMVNCIEAQADLLRFPIRLLTGESKEEFGSEKLEETLNKLLGDVKSIKPAYKLEATVFLITSPINNGLIPDFEHHIWYTLSHKPRQSTLTHLDPWLSGKEELPNCYKIEINRKGMVTIIDEPVTLPKRIDGGPLRVVSRYSTKVEGHRSGSLIKTVNRNIEEYFHQVKI